MAAAVPAQRSAAPGVRVGVSGLTVQVLELPSGGEAAEACARASGRLRSQYVQASVEASTSTELSTFVEKATERGLPREEIARVLAEAGWSAQ